MSTTSGSSPVRRFTELLGIAVIVSVLFISLFVRLNPLAVVGGLEVGKQAPSIKAVGWVNGNRPSPEQLTGKVVVVDAWATWCRPCLERAPELVRTYEKFRDRDVVFIGLTDEGEDALPQIHNFLERAGIDWLNGYGAAETLQQFQVEAIPAVWVIGVDGMIVWNHDSPGTLDEAIEKALERTDGE